MQNVLYTEFVNQDDLALEYALEKASLDADRAIATFNAILVKESLDIREAELKCLVEGGDIDMLESLYTEAKEEVEEKKESIFTRIWEEIKKLFAKLRDFITGHSKTKKMNEMAEKGEKIAVDEQGATFIDQMKANIKKITSGEWWTDLSQARKIEAIVAGTAIIGTGVAMAIPGSRKYLVGEVQTVIDGLRKVSDKIANSTFGQATLKAKEGLLHELGKIVKKVQEFITKAVKKLLSFIPGKSEEEHNDVKNVDNNADGGAPFGNPNLVKGAKENRAKYLKKSKEYFRKLNEIKTKFQGNDRMYEIEKLREQYGVIGESVDDSFDFDMNDSIFESYDDVDFGGSYLEYADDIDEIASLIESL